MIPPTDQDWRRRRPPTAGPDGPSPESTQHGAPNEAVERTRATPGAGTERCPVCEFASADADDVYAHLLTAHRKSTISAALLRG